MRFRARLITFWESVSASYWFIPTVMCVAALLMSFLMVWIDRTLPSEWVTATPWLYTGTPSGARTLLATIASSMIGLAGVVFSITIVALTLASGQFGSRLLRNFMRDKGNQITLGTFLAAFLYCLLILRKIHDSSEDNGDIFVPQVSMLVAVLTAIAGIGVLIYFIHHAAASIQAPNVIAAVFRELLAAIETLYPEHLGEEGEAVNSLEADVEQKFRSLSGGPSDDISAGGWGYLQRIEPDQLLKIAAENNLVVAVEHRPGQFVQRDDIVLRVWPSGRANEDAIRAFRDLFTIGDQRSISQDAEFAIEQLVEVAARALSPGVNDPFTAIQCVDRLGAALSDLASRRMPSPYRVDDSGHLRVRAYAKSFGDFVDAAYTQIRQYAANSLDVLLRMLEAFERVARHVRTENDRRSLTEHAEMVYEVALVASGTTHDRDAVESRHTAIQRALAGINSRRVTGT